MPPIGFLVALVKLILKSGRAMTQKLLSYSYKSKRGVPALPDIKTDLPYQILVEHRHQLRFSQDHRSSAQKGQIFFQRLVYKEKEEREDKGSIETRWYNTFRSRKLPHVSCSKEVTFYYTNRRHSSTKKLSKFFFLAPQNELLIVQKGSQDI